MNKFKLGDMVYALEYCQNKFSIVEGKIKRIELVLTTDKEIIYYEFGNDIWDGEFMEQDLALTKIECINNYIKLLEDLKNEY